MTTNTPAEPPIRDPEDLSPKDRLQRREMLKRAMFGGAAGAAAFLASPVAKAVETPREQAAKEIVARASRGMRPPTIKDIRVFEIGAGGLYNCTVVKVVTDQDGLYGWGDASVARRSALVRTAVEKYLKPLLIGKPTSDIGLLWQACFQSSHYKNDQVQNAAIGGICDALWDIKGRQVGLPVYQLVGGKFRDAAEVYQHIGSSHPNPDKAIDSALKCISQGARNVQLNMTMHNSLINDAAGRTAYDQEHVISRHKAAFREFRRQAPAHIRLGTDAHSAFEPAYATRFLEMCEEFGPWYWVENPVSVDDQMSLRIIRKKTDVPLSIGELFNNPAEWRPVIEERLVDYVRHRISHVGGFTPIRRIAAFAENFQIKFGWHAGPASPIAHMTNLTVDIVTPNFGIHEYLGPAPDRVLEVFSGTREVRDGFAYISEKPGWGIEVNEAVAARMPLQAENDVVV